MNGIASHTFDKLGIDPAGEENAAASVREMEEIPTNPTKRRRDGRGWSRFNECIRRIAWVLRPDSTENTPAYESKHAIDESAHVHCVTHARPKEIVGITPSMPVWWRTIRFRIAFTERQEPRSVKPHTVKSTPPA